MKFSKTHFRSLICNKSAPRFET